MYRVEDKYNCTAAELVMLQSRMEAVLRPDVNEGDSEDIVLQVSILTIWRIPACMIRRME